MKYINIEIGTNLTIVILFVIFLIAVIVYPS